MTSARETPTLSDYWAILRRRRRTVITSMLVVVVIAATYVWWSGPQYTSQASVVVRPILSGPFDQSRIEDVGAGTEAKVLDSTVVAELAAKKLHRSAAEAPTLLENLTVDNPLGTLILNITYTADSPEAARRGAQAFADAYLENRQHTADAVKARALQRQETEHAALDRDLNDAVATIASAPAGSDARSAAESRRDVLLSQISQLEASSSSLTGVDTSPGQLIRPADLPDTQSGPSPLLLMIAAAALGALAGAGIALFRERTDPSIASRKNFVETVGADPIGELPELGLGAPWTVASSPTDPIAISLRRLRVAIWPRRGVGPRRVMVTTPSGTTVTDALAANLALTSARSGSSVLLAWADLPAETMLAQEIPMPEDVPEDAPLEKLVVNVPDEEGLALLPTLTPGDGNRISTDEISERLAELEGTYDVEIVVGAPVLASPEAFELSPLVDGTIVVFDVRRHRRAELEKCIDALSSTGTPVLGVVAVSVPASW
jgi:Mrp family chromosome partitioning ATPase/capsular polysaccharide biosynthesis protein